MSRDRTELSRRNVIKGTAAGSAALLAGCSGDGGGGSTGSDGGDGSDDGGSSTETDSSGSGGMSGQTVSWLIHYQSEKPQFEKIIADFEEKTGATVELRQVPSNKYQQNLNAATGTANAPDVFYQVAGTGTLGKYVSNGVAMNLSGEVTEETLDAMVSAAVTGCKFGSREALSWLDTEGDPYALPLNWFGLMYWYNRDLLEEIGIVEGDLKHRMDMTWSEFKGYCKKAKDAGKIPIVMGGSGADVKNIARWVGGHMVKYVGTQTFLETIWGRNDKRFDDPEFVEGLSQMKELYDKGYINQSVNAISRAQSLSQVYNDDALFYFQGSWMPNQIKRMIGEDARGVGDKIDYFWTPYFNQANPAGQKELYFVTGGVNGVNAKTTEERENKEAAVAFLNHLYSKKSQEILFKEGGIPVSRLDVWNDLNQAQKIQQQVLKQGNKAEAAYPLVPSAMLPKTREAFYNATSGVFSGGNPKDLLSKVEQAIQTDLKDL